MESFKNLVNLINCGNVGVVSITSNCSLLTLDNKNSYIYTQPFDIHYVYFKDKKSKAHNYIEYKVKIYLTKNQLKYFNNLLNTSTNYIHFNKSTKEYMVIRNKTLIATTKSLQKAKNIDWLEEIKKRKLKL